LSSPRLALNGFAKNAGRRTRENTARRATMFEMIFEGLRKAQESSLQAQQEIFKQWTQGWTAAPGAGGGSSEWTRNLQKRTTELTLEMLNKHRESLDAAYRSGIQVIEQAFRLSEAETPEAARRMVEDLWRKLLEISKDQSENQFREVQKWAEKSFEMNQQNGGA
jgi:hypothetical protein